MKSLQAQIDAAWKKKVEIPHEEKTRKVGLSAFANIALATPVKSGRARGNWNTSIDTVDGSTNDQANEINFAGATAAAAKWVMGQTFYISNNLPYIKRLNDGYSKQAPANFVEIGVAQAKGSFR